MCRGGCQGRVDVVHVREIALRGGAVEEGSEARVGGEPGPQGGSRQGRDEARGEEAAGDGLGVQGGGHRGQGGGQCGTERVGGRHGGSCGRHDGSCLVHVGDQNTGGPRLLYAPGEQPQPPTLICARDAPGDIILARTVWGRSGPGCTCWAGT